MPIVNFKFKCSLDVETIKFDQVFISIREVIEIIKQKKKISERNDLELINERTNEAYADEKVLISDGTYLLVTRIPAKSQNKTNDKHKFICKSSSVAKVDINAPSLALVNDLSKHEASEEDKIIALIYQSTAMYNPINYSKSNAANQVGPVPPSYRCRKCYKKGHWIKDCFVKDSEKLRRTTGIPRSQLVTVNDPKVKGALITENGSFAVKLLDHQTYTEQCKKKSNTKSTKPPKEEILDVSSNEVAADNSNRVFSKISFTSPPPSISEKVVKPGIANINLQDIPILKRSTLPLPISNYPKMPGIIPNVISSIDFSKPPPQIHPNFYAVKQQNSLPTDIDKMEVFINDLRRKDEEDREKQKRQIHKNSRSRSRSKNRSRSRSTRHHFKERNCVTRPRGSDLTKFNRSKELQYQDRNMNKREIMQDQDRRDGQWKKSLPNGRDFYGKRKYRK